MEQKPVIAFTPGDPAGIGPDLAVALASCPPDCRIVIIGDRELLRARARQLRIDVEFPEADGDLDVRVCDIKCAVEPVPGKPDGRNSRYVLSALDEAAEGCMRQRYDAVVTGPVNKEVIVKSGIEFTGHTEYFASRTSADSPVMMLVAGGLRVALATTHVRLSEVPAAITKARLRAVIEQLRRDLETRFGIESPRIAVCGLNPHAGEGGVLGDEEVTTISPVIEEFRKLGLRIEGPVPADTAFTRDRLRETDVVLAMYHDQGLPVIKHSGFGEIANVTLGLPIIRTSVDHGTAYELAGSGRADRGSMMAAFNMAMKLARVRAGAS